MNVLVNIDVPDLQQAISFYTEAFGLVHVRTMDDAVAELSGAVAPIYLLVNAAGTAPTQNMNVSRAYSRHWTPVHIDFVVDNLDVEAARVVACGAVRESECNEWNGSRCITFSDPFGHGFCLISFDRETYCGA